VDFCDNTAYIRLGDTLCCANSSTTFTLGNFYAKALFSSNFTFSFNCGCHRQQYLTTNSIGGYICKMPYRGPCKICVTNNNLLFTHEWKINRFTSLYRMISPLLAYLQIKALDPSQCLG
jgi:hypothetical protein